MCIQLLELVDLVHHPLVLSSPGRGAVRLHEKLRERAELGALVMMRRGHSRAEPALPASRFRERCPTHRSRTLTAALEGVLPRAGLQVHQQRQLALRFMLGL